MQKQNAKDRIWYFPQIGDHYTQFFLAINIEALAIDMYRDRLMWRRMPLEILKVSFLLGWKVLLEKKKIKSLSEIKTY